MSIDHVEDVEVLYGETKLPKQSAIEFGPIHGVLPSKAVHNPLTVSTISHKTAFPYRTRANSFRNAVGVAESAKELAVAEQLLVSPLTWNVEFQPFTFNYDNPLRGSVPHTIDIRLTTSNMRRTLIFVRNQDSLEKPITQVEIESLKSQYPKTEADNFIVINGDEYTYARRLNLSLMHRFVCFQPDPVSDAMVLDAVKSLKTLWYMKDLRDVLDLRGDRIFQSCLRLIAGNYLGANMDAVIGHQSHIWMQCA